MRFLTRRLLWFAVGAGARYVVRRGTARAVAGQRERLAEQLPARVVKVADRLPGDPLAAGSSMAVAGKAAKSMVGVSNSARQTTHRQIKRIGGWRERPARLRYMFDREIGESARQLRSEYRRATEGVEAATDELLDRRRSSIDDDDIWDEVPAPVARGRFRRRLRSRPNRPARPQRTYRPPTKPWERLRPPR